MAKAPRAQSLRLRLAFMLIASGAVMATALVLVFQGFARQIATDAQDGQLLASATSILESVAIEEGELQIDIPYAALSMLGSVSDDRVFYRIDRNEEFLSGYEDLVIPTRTNETAFSNGSYLTAEVRLVSVSRVVGSGSETAELSVSVAQTTEGIDARMQAVFRQAAIAGAAFFATATLLALWVSDRAFMPLRTLAASVGRRGPSDLRPIRQDVPKELIPLVGSFNDFTRRLKRALGRSEEFITEAAHRIRTPLAIVRTQADLVAHRVGQAEDRAALRALVQAVDESSRTATQLLDHAMVNLRTDTLKTEMIPLASFLKDSVERLRPVAQMRDIALTFHSETEIQVSADPVLLESAIGNLLDNALKYTAPETEITVSLSEAQSGAVIEICDQGAGFADKDPTQLFERFKRGETTEGTVGSGLGLTIARDVITAHRGDIKLSNNAEGGACVTVSLPV